MKTALQYLKEEFPDWKDWPKGSVEAQVKVMQNYAREVAQSSLYEASMRMQTEIYSYPQMDIESMTVKTELHVDANRSAIVHTEIQTP